MVGLGTGGIAVFNRAGNLFAHGTAPTTVRILPCQAILFTRSADDTLRVLIHIVAFALLECVFLLRLYIAVADSNSVQFIASDATVEELLAAGFGVEGPSVA